MSVRRLLGRKTLQRLGSLTILALAASGAQAADYLRGAYAPEAEPKSSGVDWAGVYFGVHGGYTNAQVDPSGYKRRLAQDALPNSTYTDLLEDTINLRKVNKTRSTFGAFAGYNYLWDDVVLGLEVDYTRGSVNASTQSGPYGLYRTAAGEEVSVVSSTTARARVRDWGTIRGRVGWAAGYFLPYLTAGVAIGNVDGRATVTGYWERRDVSTPPARPLIATDTFTGTVGRRGITYGGVFGAGVDMAFFSNIFVRAEWQHIQFASGGNRPEVSINTARVAGGVKF